MWLKPNTSMARRWCQGPVLGDGSLYLRISINFPLMWTLGVVSILCKTLGNLTFENPPLSHRLLSPNLFCGHSGSDWPSWCELMTKVRYDLGKDEGQFPYLYNDIDTVKPEGLHEAHYLMWGGSGFWIKAPGFTCCLLRICKSRCIFLTCWALFPVYKVEILMAPGLLRMF